MISYASRTGTRRNLAALRAACWGLLVSRAGAWRTEGFNLWAADNGAWADFQAGRDFQEDEFDKFLAWIERQPIAPQWLVLPDIVAQGARSLALSIRFMNRCRTAVPMVLIAVQNGMKVDDLRPFVGPHVGIFLGGSTDWKLQTMSYWGDFCAAVPCHYHVARVNTAKRYAMAAAAGACSVDGSSATRFAVNVPALDNAGRQPDFLSPRPLQ